MTAIVRFPLVLSTRSKLVLRDVIIKSSLSYGHEDHTPLRKRPQKTWKATVGRTINEAVNRQEYEKEVRALM